MLFDKLFGGGSSNNGGQAPTPPDPYRVAGAQTGTNIATARETARLNRYNQSTPFGGVSWRATGNASVPWERQVSLSPEQQRLLRTQQTTDQVTQDNLLRAQRRRPMRRLGSGFNIGRLPRLQVGDASRNRVENAMLERLRPRFDQDRSRLETQLSNQGFARGTEAWNNAMDLHTRAQNDARLGAVLAGGQEHSRQFGQQLANRQQRLSERQMQRQIPLNEILAMSGRAGTINVPQGGPAPMTSIAPTDFSGLVMNNYNQAMGAHNAAQNRQAQQGSGLGEILGAAGSLFGAFM